MIIHIFIIVTAISPTVYGSLPAAEHAYPLIHYTKHISQEHFHAGRPLVILMPLAEEDSTNKEVGYLIEELHTSGRWPLLVYNTSCKMNENMYTEIHPHGSYIILVSRPCKEGEDLFSGLWQQLFELTTNDKLWLSRNPRGKYIVYVASNCTQLDNTGISRAILIKLWRFGVTHAIVLFLKSNEQAGNDLQQNTNQSAQSTYLELHTWYPYENSDRCNPDEGTVPVKVFTVRKLSDIRRVDTFRRDFGKNLHGCPIKVYVRELFPLVYEPKRFCYKAFDCQYVYEDGWEIEMLRIIGNVLNISLDIADAVNILHGVLADKTKDSEKFEGKPFMFVGMIGGHSPYLDYFHECTRSYLAIRFTWFTPCAVKFQRWSRFFNIFSVTMWICFALSLVLAVVTVSCISNYRHKSHLHQYNSYSNIFSVTSNIIAVSLSVSVNTQPRSAPLRLFFFCWVCYSVAISTVFQAYLTTFLIEPGYEQPIRTVEEMLKSEVKFGYPFEFKRMFKDTSDPVDLAILNNAVECADEILCYIWASVYHNISSILDE